MLFVSFTAKPTQTYIKLAVGNSTSYGKWHAVIRSMKSNMITFITSRIILTHIGCDTKGAISLHGTTLLPSFSSLASCEVDGFESKWVKTTLDVISTLKPYGEIQNEIKWAFNIFYSTWASTHLAAIFRKIEHSNFPFSGFQKLERESSEIVWEREREKEILNFVYHSR